MKQSNLDRLHEIQEEMLDLLSEARGILSKDAPRSVRERAKAYWLAHAEMALTNEHQYLGGSMCSFEDTLGELERGEEEDE